MSPIWTRRIADEFWSGAVTPLTYSLLAEPMAEHMVRRVLRQAGLTELASAPILHRHASHVYVNGAILGPVVSLLPPVLRSDGLLELLPQEVRRGMRPATTLAGSARTIEMVLRFALQEPAWSPWQRARAFERACAATRARFAIGREPRTETSDAAVLAEITAVRSALGAFLETVSWGVVFAYVFYHLLHELCRRWAVGLDAEGAALTVGLPGVASLEAARDVAHLGALLVRDPTLAAMIRDRPNDAAARVRAAGGPAADALASILARHGHRLVGRDLACSTWREAPEIVLALALRGAEHALASSQPADERTLAEPSRSAYVPSPDRRRLDATARLEAAIARGPAGPLRLGAFRVALTAAQRYYVVRENMRYYADFYLGQLRELALTLGTRLTDRGRIAAPDDVCFLTLEELARACAGAESVIARVEARRAETARDAASPPPLVLADDAATATATPPAAADAPRCDDTLRGECAAPGVCHGRARVVHGADDFAAFARGDVMVAAYTDPGWTPILELASGLVLDAGGQLSHGAIVARELGIPALVNVTDATRTIRSGDLLEVDATAGRVRIRRPP